MKHIIISICICIGLIFGNIDVIMAEPSSAEQIKAVQQALNDAGYNCGAVDGLAGKKTEAAIKAFEKEKGLDVDGVIDDALIAALGIKPGSQTADGHKLYKIEELVFKVPEEWGYYGSTDMEMENMSFLPAGDHFLLLSFIVVRNENTHDPIDDLWLKINAESVMQGVFERSYSGKAELLTLSNGKHAASLTDIQTDYSYGHYELPETACRVYCTLVDDYEVVALALYKASKESDDEIFGELDRILCSFKKQ